MALLGKKDVKWAVRSRCEETGSSSRNTLLCAKKPQVPAPAGMSALRNRESQPCKTAPKLKIPGSSLIAGLEPGIS